MDPSAASAPTCRSVRGRSRRTGRRRAHRVPADGGHRDAAGTAVAGVPGHPVASRPAAGQLLVLPGTGTGRAGVPRNQGGQRRPGSISAKSTSSSIVVSPFATSARSVSRLADGDSGGAVMSEDTEVTLHDMIVGTDDSGHQVGYQRIITVLNYFNVHVLTTGGG